MKDDTISRAAVMESLTKEYNRRRTGDGLKLAWIEKAVNEVPSVPTCEDAVSRQAAIDAFEKAMCEDGFRSETGLIHKTMAYEIIRHLPSAQPETHEERTETHDVCLDTISRQAAIDFIDAGHLCNPNEPRWSDNEIVNFLKSRPSAQPQITHCAECIHWKHSDVRKNYCEVFDWTNKAKDFCSFAERRFNE